MATRLHTPSGGSGRLEGSAKVVRQATMRMCMLIALALRSNLGVNRGVVPQAVRSQCSSCRCVSSPCAPKHLVLMPTSQVSGGATGWVRVCYSPPNPGGLGGWSTPRRSPTCGLGSQPQKRNTGSGCYSKVCVLFPLGPLPRSINGDATDLRHTAAPTNAR